MTKTKSNKTSASRKRKSTARLAVPDTAASTTPRRLPQLDALRGIAVMAMIGYHFGYDLNYLGWIHQTITEDLRWQTVRTLILSSFLLAVGASQALAEFHGASLRTRWQRIAKIAGAALLVTAGSSLMFPESAIYFGVLHAIAAMSVLLLLPLRSWQAAWLGGAIIVLGNVYANAIFDHPAVAWLGLMTYKPLTEDYVPLLPWLGVCLIGYAAMKVWLARPRAAQIADAAPAIPRWLLWSGQHSLLIYLLHQPLLLGVLFPITRLLKHA